MHDDCVVMANSLFWPSSDPAHVQAVLFIAFVGVVVVLPYIDMHMSTAFVYEYEN